jgi:hypothetical protein
VACALVIRDTLIHNWREAFETVGTLQAEIIESSSVEAEFKWLREENRWSSTPIVVHSTPVEHFKSDLKIASSYSA